MRNSRIPAAPLKPSDVELFDHIVLGGILGNVHGCPINPQTKFSESRRQHEKNRAKLKNEKHLFIAKLRQ